MSKSIAAEAAEAVAIEQDRVDELAREHRVLDPDDPPEAVASNPVLRRVIWERVHQKNKNFIFFLVGETGSGKSWAALRIAEALHPDFHADQVTFSLPQFFDHVNANFPQGTVTVLDEGGVSASHRDWYEDAHQYLNYILQTWRHQNRIAIITLPELNKIDSVARGRGHGLGEMVGVDQANAFSKIRYRNIITIPDTGEVIKEYPKLMWDGGRRKFKGFNVSKPSRDLRQAYEVRKEAFTDALNESIRTASRAVETEEADPNAVAEQILVDGVEEYISENNGVEYINRDLIKADFGVGRDKSKTIKSILLRELPDRRNLM